MIEHLRLEGAAAGDFGFEYFDEADNLENDPDLYGGHTAIVMFSKMRMVRVLIHETENLEAITRDATHPAVPETAPVVHIAYNGRNHYDAVEFVPTLRQHEPLQDEHTSDDAAVRSESTPRAKTTSSSSIAPKTNKKTRKFATKPSPKPKANKTKNKQTTSKVLKHATKKQVRGRRRVRTKMPAPPFYRLTIYEEVCKAQLRQPASHPLAEFEEELLAVVSALRASPTVPPGRSRASVDEGDLWPSIFCAFLDCDWEMARGTEDDLLAHLQRKHREDLIHAARLLPTPTTEDVAVMTVYNEAIAEILRVQAPLAGPSIDRRALHAFADATKEDKIEALICFCCGCVHTYIQEDDKRGKSNISWISPVDITSSGEVTLFGLPLDVAHSLFGMDNFIAKYGNMEGYPNLTESGELSHWNAAVYNHHTDEFVEFICCPEDHKCDGDLGHPTSHILCEECLVPLCQHCHSHIKAQKLPPLSLANDMWTGFAPAMLYTDQVTVMEMICASPCITTLLCFSMETRYRSDHLLDEKAHMARHRVGARGNALTFPLPWEQLIETLQRSVTQTLQEDDSNTEPGVPWTGSELEEHVRVLLKTNKQGQTSEAELKTLIHQATVRRDIVVKLILHMKARHFGTL